MNDSERCFDVLRPGESDEDDLVAEGELFSHIPCADGRSGQLLAYRVPGNDQNSSGLRRFDDIERSDEVFVTAQVPFLLVNGRIHQAEEPPQHAVRHHSSRLDFIPALTQTREVFGELVDGIHRRDSLLGHLDGRFTVTARFAKVEGGGVKAAPGNTSTYGKGDRRRKRLLERFFVQVLVERVKRIALEEISLFVRPELGHRGMMFVERERLGHIGEAPTAQVESPSEVDVLEEHEVSLVEAAERVVNGATHEHRRTRPEENVLGHFRRFGDRLGSEWFVPHAIPGHRGTDEVNELAVPVEHATGDGTDVVGFGKLLDGCLDPRLVRAGIVVQERDELS